MTTSAKTYTTLWDSISARASQWNANGPRDIGARRRELSKRGLEAADIGRSKCGPTTKVHAAVEALGLPVRVAITPGQWGDSPPARGLIEGLGGVHHVSADAAHDADHLRAFITDCPVGAFDGWD